MLMLCVASQGKSDEYFNSRQIKQSIHLPAFPRSLLSQPGNSKKQLCSSMPPLPALLNCGWESRGSIVNLPASVLYHCITVALLHRESKQVPSAKLLVKNDLTGREGHILTWKFSNCNLSKLSLSREAEKNLLCLFCG